MAKFGIDISHWQGNISISQAKSERGVEFVIIKLGGADAGKYKDSKFDDYYNQCKSIGMPVGAYFYGNAKTVAQAEAEAEYFISLLAGKQFEYPVYYDVEGNMLNNDRNTLTNIIIAFCDKVERNGYFTGIYTSDSHFQSKVDDSRLQRFTHWVAKYSSNAPTTPHDVWQFGGGTNFLQNKTICGRTVDQDYCYRDFETEIKKAGLNGFSASSAPAPTPAPAPVLKSNEEIANEVIAGNWGSGEDRKNRLAAAGYDYNAVQSIVNQKLAPAKKSVDEIAKEVLAGKWGNGNDRKSKLEAAGYNYSEVQAKVNALCGASTPSAPSYRTYTVKSGDSLWKIAARQLGSGSRYPEIKSLNGLKSDTIYAGQKLKLPN